MAKTIAVCNQKGGVAKCVTPGTKILLSNGTICYAHQLFDECLQDNPTTESIGSELYLTPKNPIEVLSIDDELRIRPAHVLKLYRGHADTIYSILTERGNHIAVTPEHPLVSLSGGRLSWVKADGLKKGNFVAVARTLPVRAYQKISLHLLSSRIRILVDKKIRDKIASYLRLFLEYSDDKKDRLALLLLGENPVCARDLYNRFSKNFCYSLIREWLAKGIVVRGKRTFKKGFSFSADKNKFVNYILETGINSKAFNYLTSLNIIGYENVIGLTYTNRSGRKCNPFYWNGFVDDEIARFIAVIIAEGNVSASRIVVCNKSDDIISLLENFCIRFNLSWRKEITKNGLSELRILKAGTLVKVLEDIFEIPCLYEGKSHNVKIPNIIMSGRPRVLSAYLSTYIDCEGYVSDKRTQVSITSASEENIRRLQYAFLQFGISSSVSHYAGKATNSKKPHTRSYFKISISGAENIKKISDHCSPTLDYKKAALRKRLNVKTNTNIDVVPINKVLKEIRYSNFLYQNELGIGGTISGYECLESIPSKSALGAITTLLEDRIEEKEFRYLKKLSESDIFWDKIKTITPYKYRGYVYDLTVEKHHNFICGDGAFISHNTTTAINLSSYLAIQNRKTLLIDLDPQSNATSGIGIDKHSIKLSIYNVLHEHTSLESVITATQIQHLDIAPSNLDLTGAEVELVNVMNREYRLKKSIEKIKHLYDFILIDCPPSLGLLTINALAAADSVIIPIQCEYYALEGLSQLMNTVNLIKDNLNNDLKVEGVLLTMADYRTNLTKEVIEEVKKFFGDKVYKTIIPRSIKLTEAPGFGKPIALYDKNSIGAEAYQNLAKEILNGLPQVLGNKELITESEEQNGQKVG